MENIKLSQISVGLSDGEIEAETKNFMNTFYTGNKKYEELLTNHKCFVTGRKGTGKTILAKYYAEKQNNAFKRKRVKYLVLDKYDANEYIELSYLNENVKLQFFFQKYYILKELALVILDRNYNILHFRMNFWKFYKYKKAREKLALHFDDVYIDGMFDAVRMIEKIKDTYDNSVESKIGSGADKILPSTQLAGQIREGTSKEIEKEFTKKNFVQRTESLEQQVKNCLNYVSVELILDDFDEINIEDNERRFEYIGNFIETVKRVNRSILDYSDKSRVILLLREDYLNKLSSRKPNIQKTINDTLVELNWTDRSNKQALLDLVVNKIMKSNSELDAFTLEEVKARFFPPYVDSRLPFENALEHMTEYSFYRPRDLVVYIETIIKNYGDSNCFTENLVTSCEAEYSRRFIGEIQNEMSSHYEPEYHEKLWESLRIQNKQKFSSEGFIIEMTSKGIYASQEEALEAFNILFQFSVLGNYRYIKKGKDRITKFTFQFREPGRIKPDHSSRFQVHKGVIKGLNIV